MAKVMQLGPSLREAFANREEQIYFSLDDRDFMFLADYDEVPIIIGLLYVAVEDGRLIAIDETGELFPKEQTELDPWRGLPQFMVEKIIAMAHLYDLGVE